MEPIDYFQPEISDIKTLIDFRIRFIIEYWGTQEKDTILELTRNLESFYLESLPSKTYLCWLARMNEEIAGIGGLAVRHQPGSFKNPSGRVGYIMNMFTIPDRRRMGISSNMLTRLTQSAREMGIHHFELNATKEGEPVYIKHGFKIHGEPTYRFSG